MDLIKKLGKGVQIAEAERDRRRHEGFVADLFRGKASFSLLTPWHESSHEEQDKAERIAQEFKGLLRTCIDPEEVDRTDEVPGEALEQLCRFGFFGLKLPEEYGGLQLSQTSYVKVMSLVASWCGGTAASLSAANTIGVGGPIKHCGTLEQKQRYLPVVSRVPSGFAFTEKEAGSDPASMGMYALRVRSASGEVIGYRLNGEKLWTTNGPKDDRRFLSPLLCVIAKTVDKPEELSDESKKPVFSAFVVSTDAEGVRVVQRCQFEGLRGMYNGVTEFKDVYVSKSQLIGEQEGTGFRIALEALNTGRITVAGACLAIVKQCLLIDRWWGCARKQWGKKIGKHELIGSGMFASDLADAFAMEAMIKFASGRVDRDLDARLEAAVCKVFASERGWRVVDNTMQARGGRGGTIPSQFPSESNI